MHIIIPYSSHSFIPIKSQYINHYSIPWNPWNQERRPVNHYSILEIQDPKTHSVPRKSHEIPLISIKSHVFPMHFRRCPAGSISRLPRRPTSQVARALQSTLQRLRRRLNGLRGVQARVKKCDGFEAPEVGDIIPIQLGWWWSWWWWWWWWCNHL
jgi:hypothetical protein